MTCYSLEHQHDPLTWFQYSQHKVACDRKSFTYTHPGGFEVHDERLIGSEAEEVECSRTQKILGRCQDRPFSCLKSCHMKDCQSACLGPYKTSEAVGQWSRDSNFLGIISCHHNNTFSERWEDPKCQLQCWMVIRDRLSFAFQKESSVLFYFFLFVLEGTSCLVSRLIFLMQLWLYSFYCWFKFFLIPVVFRKYALRLGSVPSALYKTKCFVLIYNISLFN